MDLGGGGDGGAGIARGRALADGHRGADAVDAVHGRLLHPLEELPRVGGEALDVAAVTLGVQRVEGQAALARARDAGDHHELAGGDGDVDVLEVVDADAPGNDGFGHGPLRVARPHGAALRGGTKAQS